MLIKFFDSLVEEKSGGMTTKVQEKSVSKGDNGFQRWWHIYMSCIYVALDITLVYFLLGSTIIWRSIFRIVYVLWAIKG